MAVNTREDKNGPKILALHDEGWTPRRIAHHLDLSESNVYSHLRRRGLTPNRKAAT